MKKIIIPLLFCIPVSVFAQLDAIGTFNRYVTESWAGQYQRVGQYKVKGSPYLFGESMSGKIKYQGGDFVKTDKILYDLNDQKVGPEVNGQIFKADQTIEAFVIQFPGKYSNEEALFKSAATYGAKKGPAYFNVLSEGSAVHLLKAYRIKVVADPSNMMDKEARIFEQFVEYYIYDVQAKSISKVKMNKKDVADALKATPALQTKLNAYTGVLSSELDLLSLVETLNQ